MQKNHGAPLGGRIGIEVLTGFLGSGKTTLLNQFLRSSHSKNVAVIVNEIGDIGLDQLALTEVAENMLLLDSGCLCCTLTGSFRETVINLLAQTNKQGLDITRIVVETTGLANPLPFLHNILGDRALMDVVQLERIITVVDCHSFLSHIDSQPEFGHQIAVAETLVLTKTDLIDQNKKKEVLNKVAQINPFAQKFISSNGDNAAEVFAVEPGRGQLEFLYSQNLGLYSSELISDQTSHHFSGNEEINSLSFYIDQDIYWTGISAWWHLVQQKYGKKMLRCKGLFKISDADKSMVFVQMVGDFYHPPQYLSQWPDKEDARSRLVCIGNALDEAWLQESLRAFSIEEAGVKPYLINELSLLLGSNDE